MYRNARDNLKIMHSELAQSAIAPVYAAKKLFRVTETRDSSNRVTREKLKGETRQDASRFATAAYRWLPAFLLESTTYEAQGVL